MGGGGDGGECDVGGGGGGEGDVGEVNEKEE